MLYTCGISLTDALDPSTQSTQKGGGGKYAGRTLGWESWVGSLIIIFFIGYTCIARIQLRRRYQTGQTRSLRLLKYRRTLTPTATSIPVPTITPSLVPIQIELAKILDEYDQNKVRANTRLRYQEPKSCVHFRICVSSRRILCHCYTRTRRILAPKVILLLRRRKSSTLRIERTTCFGNGRVSGTDGYSSRIYMFACEFEGIQLEAIQLYWLKSFVCCTSLLLVGFNIFHRIQR